MKLGFIAALLAANLLPGIRVFAQTVPPPATDTVPATQTSQNDREDDRQNWDRTQREVARAQREVIEAQRAAGMAQREAQRSLLETRREAERTVVEAQREALSSVMQAQREARSTVMEAQREMAMAQRSAVLAQSQSMREATRSALMMRREAMLAAREVELARASEATRQFRDMMEEMAKDHLIERGKDTQVEYRDGNLLINGKEQPAQVRDKYKHYFNEKNQSLRLNLGQGIAI